MSHSRPSRQLWLCLRFPHWPLDLLPATPGQPRVVVEQQQLRWLCPQALALGLEPGLSVGNALLLLEDPQALQLHRRDRELEQKALQGVAQLCYDFTPHVSLWPQHRDGRDNDLLECHQLQLEISRSLKLFHGLPSLLQQLREHLQQHGFTPLASLGHSPKAAWLLGQEHDAPWPTAETAPTGDNFMQQLQGLPLQALAPLHPTARQWLPRLQQVGMHTFQQLLQQPRRELGQRYGTGLLQCLDEISGTRPEPQLEFQPPLRFSCQRQLNFAIDNWSLLNYPMESMLEELQQFLRQRQLHCNGLQWRFLHTDRSSSERQLQLSEPLNITAPLLRLTQLRLEQQPLPRAVESLMLESEQLHYSALLNHSLFRELGASRNRSINPLLDLLRARLGREQLSQLRLQDEHLPEYQQQLVDAGTPLPVSHHTLPASLPLPLWLRSQPHPVAAPWRGGPTLLSDPLRLESHWWQTHQQRDYFVARDPRGLHWVYCDRHSGQWFIHGHFS